MAIRTPLIPMDEAFKRVGRTHSIRNNNAVISRDHYTFSTREGIKDQFILNHNNLKQFKEIFGAPEFSFQGEYRDYVWFVPFEDITMVVYSGERGTSYEIRSDQPMNKFKEDTRTGETIIRFLTELTERLKQKR